MTSTPQTGNSLPSLVFPCLATIGSEQVEITGYGIPGSHVAKNVVVSRRRNNTTAASHAAGATLAPTTLGGGGVQTVSLLTMDLDVSTPNFLDPSDAGVLVATIAAGSVVSVMPLLIDLFDTGGDCEIVIGPDPATVKNLGDWQVFRSGVDGTGLELPAYNDPPSVFDGPFAAIPPVEWNIYAALYSDGTPPTTGTVRIAITTKTAS